jgi:hypothetical protein
MTYQDLQPNLIASYQPYSDTLTVITTIPDNSNAYGSMFITNVDDQTIDYVRLAIKHSTDIFGDQNYLLYDTPIFPNNMFQLSNIALSAGDQVIVYSRNGLSSFNMTGNIILNILS